MKTKLKLSALLPTLPDEIAQGVIAGLDKEPELIDIKRVVMAEKLVEGEDDDNRRIKIIASTRDMDRDAEILFPKGVDFSQFKLSPKILNGHNHVLPFIGKAVTMSKNDKDVPMTIEFAPTEDGENFRVLSMFVPLSFSVGFMPTDILYHRDSGWGDQVAALTEAWPEFRAVKNQVTAFIRKWMLLEVSAVNVASNPRALQIAAAKAVEAGTIKAEDARVCVKAFGGSVVPEVKTKDNPDPQPPKKKEPVKKEPLHIKRVVSVKEYKQAVKIYSEPMTQDDINNIVGASVRTAFDLATGKV